MTTADSTKIKLKPYNSIYVCKRYALPVEYIPSATKIHIMKTGKNEVLISKPNILCLDLFYSPIQ